MYSQIFILIFFFVFPAVFSGTSGRSPDWAVPVPNKYLDNLYMVNEDLYRGAQPDENGFKALKTLGIKTIVNLRNFHSDLDMIKGLRFKYFPIGMNTWQSPDPIKLKKFINIVTDKSNTPVFLHCLHGSDRTGLYTAVYRVIVQGWPREKAAYEMIKGGYGFHSVWSHLQDYVLQLNKEELREDIR